MKNSTTNKNKIVSSIVPTRDNLNGRFRQVNNILQKLCWGENVAFLKRHNSKPRQHSNYGDFHLNIVGRKILADNFILPLSR